MAIEDIGRMWLQKEIRQAAKEVLQEQKKAQNPTPAGKTAPKPSPTSPESRSKPRKPRKAPQTAGNRPQTARKAVRAPQTTPTPAQARRAGIRVQVEDVPEPPARTWVRPPPKITTDAHTVPGPAPCRICGGGVEPGGRYWGPWRQHPTCERIAAWPPARLRAAAAALGLGMLDETDATLVPMTVPVYADTHPEPTWSREPTRARLAWRHVDAKALRRAMKRLPQVRVEAGVDPSPCATGPCAWCGVVEATGWTDAGHQWANGDPAPLCGGCHAAWVRYSEPSFPEDVRPALAELVTGVPIQMGETPPAGLRTYAEVAGDDHAGNAEPWAHLPAEAVRSYRFTIWSRFGFRFCPPEHRAEVQEWAAEQDRSRAERAADAAAVEADRANVHGF